MILSINQPAYLPWPGYFDRIEASDLHVILDHVQFEKNSLVNRNRIRTPEGWTWLTIPVVTSGKFGNLPITELCYADGGRWRRKHWNAIQSNYARAPCFQGLAGDIQSHYEEQQKSDFFLPPVLALNCYFLDLLKIKTSIERSSQMKVTTNKSELVLEMCQMTGADTYISGPLGRDYLDLDRFRKSGIDVLFHDYKPQTYIQAWPGFEPGMAVLDLLANYDAASAGEIMRSGRRLNAAKM